MPGISGFGALAQPHEGTKLLPVKKQVQEMRNWCWAACISMAKDFMGQPLSQRNVVEKIFGAPVDDLCAVDLALGPCGLDCDPPVDGKVVFQIIKEEIGARRPVICQVAWNKGGDHVVLIVGYRQHDQHISILDPHNAALSLGNPQLTGWHPYAEFVDALGHGRWTQTYTGLRSQGALIS